MYRIGNADTRKRRNGNCISFIESYCRSSRITGSVGKIHKVEITLKFTIFAWCSMDTNQYCIENNFFTIYQEGEIIFIHLNLLPLFPGTKPFRRCYVYTVYIINTFVHFGLHGDGALIRNFCFAGISTGYECNNLFHVLGLNTWPYQRCSFSFFASNSSTVSRYISSGTQTSTGQTEAHWGSS